MLRVTLVTALVTTLFACGGPLEGPGASEGSAQQALNAAPVIVALNRTGSPPAGGMLILMIGSNLDPTGTVTFGGVAAASVTLEPQSGGLLVVTPAHPEGFVDVVVTNPDGQSATSPNFHYGPPPTLDAASPMDRLHKGDTLVLTGSNFADVYGVQVNIGGAIARITSKSSTQLVVTAPKLNAGSYPVVVSNFDSQYVVSTFQVSYR